MPRRNASLSPDGVPFIDDATSQLQHLQFAASESAFDYMRATRAYVDQHGKPVAFYSDKHGIFRVYKPSRKAEQPPMTQFGRALAELNIDIICANSSQAKGRVERAHKTLQDRLVKELRLQGICDIGSANMWLPTFVAHYNSRFAKLPRSDHNMHRPLAQYEDADAALCIKEKRTVSHQLTLQYDRMHIHLDETEKSRALQRKEVMVHDYPDGRLEVVHEGDALPFTVFDKVRRVEQGAIVDNKRLGEALAYIAELQKERPSLRAKSAPRRRGQANSAFG